MVKKFTKRKGLIKNYDFAIAALRRLFSQYSADDVATSILISELWLPNRSSSVKHQLCWGVFASMDLAEYEESSQIKSYSQYVRFIKTLHSLLPSFPMIEGFVPQADWGEIKTVFKSEITPVFFGGNVERITDFIKAYEIKFSSMEKAIKDMELALKIQAHFISSVDKKLAGSIDHILAGSIAVPSEKFWLAVKYSLDSLILDESLMERANIRSIPIGTFEMPNNASAFGDSMMDGSFQTFIYVRVYERLYPASIRNLSNIVMTFWEEEELSEESFANAVQSLSSFIDKNAENTVPGPSIFFDKKVKLNVSFPSFLLSKEVLYIPVPIRRAEIALLEKTNKDLLEALKNLKPFEFFNLKVKHLIRLASDYDIENDNVRILFVILDVSTTPSFHSVPEHPAYLIGISDFITLVSSLDSGDSLDDILFFNETGPLLAPMVGIIDQLAAYKDSDSILVEGANTPDQIFIDPHYGCEWRYNFLLDYWKLAPNYFPVKNLDWKNGSSYDGISNIFSKSRPMSSWFTNINCTEIHFICAPVIEELGLNNVRVLSLAIECFADALQQRNSVISSIPIFDGTPIFIYCEADKNTLSADDIDEQSDDRSNESLIVDWFYPKNNDGKRTQLKVSLNLTSISKAFHKAEDASLQALAAREIIEGLSRYKEVEFPSAIKGRIESTAAYPARMTMEIVQHSISVPETPSYNPPLPKHYKLARKEIAHILKSQNVSSRIYELDDAKQIIDKAKLSFRQDIHQLLGKFHRVEFLKNCVEHHERLSSVHQIEKARLKQSLRHEVSYDRQANYAASVEEFVKNSKNYRYLIEAFISLEDYGSEVPREEDILTIIGKIDWLMALYTASDVLHHDIDVGGIKISDDYIPEVFYSDSRIKLEEEYKRHDANTRLGINVNQSDKLRVNDESLIQNVQMVFLESFGFEYSLLLEVSDALSKWTSFGLKERPSYSYVFSKGTVAKCIADALSEENVEAITKVLDFLTLNPQKVRTLTGRSVIEEDVPIWEHNKRPQRYTIRPILELEKNLLLWGADAADNAHTIWLNTVHNGYLPADLEAPEIDTVLRKIKVSMEKKLEVLAHDVTSRFAPFCKRGIDFKKRFPKQNFDDVGDFDVLAYWPELNLWVTIECKYIQPPFCIKDSRRLREKMFDPSKNKSHLCKIAKRRHFLLNNFDIIRELLNWPTPTHQSEEKVRELYVAKNSYWWMFAPPYLVPTEFVQIDLLESWFKEEL